MTPSSSSMVDWDLALTTARRLVKPGPQVSQNEARAAVAELRDYAGQAHEHVAGFTGLRADTEGATVAVIDRPGWVEANVSGFRTVLEPLIEKIQTMKGTRAHAPGPVATAIGSRATGVQTGSLLAYLATKVLGQYELFPPYGEPADARPGRLLLVAPNIVAAERDMEVDARDFRLWVCLHEETHRVQFGAVPWLRGLVMGEIEAFVQATDVDPAAIARRLRAAAAVAYEAVREGFDPGSTGAEGGSLIEAVQTPEQREILDRITALMSLLEGHADFVMDGVGPTVIPSVTDIRAKFQQRRRDSGRMESVIRRLLGIDAKMRQYRDGERFVRGVVEQAGMADFNRVWERADHLPTRDELQRPGEWVARVVGAPVLEA